MFRSRLRNVLLAVCLVAAVLSSGPVSARGSAIVAVPVRTGLSGPAAFTVAPDGRIFYLARATKQIRVLSANGSTDTAFFTIPKATVAPGMVGIELHPDYPATPFLYVYGTRRIAGVDQDQLIRVKDVAGTGMGAKVLFTRPSGGDHHGGRVLFGPDGRLYLSIGDEDDPALAADLSNTAGKILRMTATGAVPAGNPFGTLVWARGLRNVFGFDFDPATDSLWATDNGPECNEEINLIVPGANYAWGPNAACTTPPAAPRNTNRDGPKPRTMPEWFFATRFGPTGAVFCSSCDLTPAVEGDLLIGDFNAGRGERPHSRRRARRRHGCDARLRPSARGHRHGTRAGRHGLPERLRRDLSAGTRLVVRRLDLESQRRMDRRGLVE